jgi:hypothetical protein
MDPRYNVALTVLSHLENNPDRTIFEFGPTKITGRIFRNMIINFALHMKAKGVNQTSCVAFETTDIIVATALSISAALHGCSWLRLTHDVIRNDLIKLTHIFHQSDIDFKDQNITSSKIDQKWTVTPKYIPVSFTGYKDLDSTWMIAQSSGTTGNAKFMEISYKSFWERVHNNVEEMIEGLSKATILYIPLKSTVQYKAITHILSNIPIVVGLQYEDIPKHPGLLIVGSHQQLLGFLREKAPPNEPFDAEFEPGGSSTSKQQAELMLKFFKTIRIGYGSTETARSTMIKLTSIDQYNNSAGIPFPDSEIKIEDGMVLVKTPRNISGYLGGEKFDWFESGDIGYIEDGQLFITGRVNEQLNIGGIKIDPNVIDDYIKTINGVVDCLTFQNTDFDLKEQLSTIIVTKLDCDPYVILQKCILNLGISKTPKNLYYTAVPRNETGKASRKDAMKAIEGIAPIKYKA